MPESTHRRNGVARRRGRCPQHRFATVNGKGCPSCPRPRAIATGAAMSEDAKLTRSFFRLVNAINEGNPHFSHTRSMMSQRREDARFLARVRAYTSVGARGNTVAWG